MILSFVSLNVVDTITPLKHVIPFSLIPDQNNIQMHSATSDNNCTCSVDDFDVTDVFTSAPIPFPAEEWDDNESRPGVSTVPLE